MSTKLTRTQHYNLREWLQRMMESGVDQTPSVVLFNGLSAQQQQQIIRNRWYRRGTCDPVRRPLLPTPDATLKGGA